MSWATVMLFGSGLVFSTGLVWFFVQAWIFAIQARTIWLIVLLTITTTVAILSQGYLCAIFVSIPPGPKPRGVTQANREAFASFPFDATASLVRRKGSDTRPSIGWEVKPAQQDAGSPARHHLPGTGAVVTTAVVGYSEENQQQQPRPAGVETQRLPSLCREKIDCSADHSSNNPARSPKSGETLHLLASSAGGGSPSSGVGGRGRGFGPARIASSNAGAGEVPVQVPVPDSDHCVEDVVESGRAHPFVLNRGKLAPVGLSKQDEFEIEEGVGMRPERGVSCESLDCKDRPVVDLGSKLQGHRRHRHHRPVAHLPHRRPSQEMRRCSTWTASGQTEETATLGSDDEDDRHHDHNEARFSCGSVGSGGDCCSESADVGCKGCAEGKEVLVREQLKRESAGAVPSLPTEHQETAATTTADRTGGGSERLTEEPVVRVSELPDVCAICLGQYATGEEVHVLPCLHIFHAECLDVWITGHPSCPYCKGDLNVLPPESDPNAESSAAAYTCSLLSSLSLLFTWPVDLAREFRDRRQRRQQQEQNQPGGQGGGHDSSHVDLASTPLATPASSPAVLPMVVA